MATEWPIAKTLIKYNNSNYYVENNQEDKKGIDIEFTERKKYWFWNDENAIDFRWSDVQEEDNEDIALTKSFVIKSSFPGYMRS